MFYEFWWPPSVAPCVCVGTEWLGFHIPAFYIHEHEIFTCSLVHGICCGHKSPVQSQPESMVRFFIFELWLSAQVAVTPSPNGKKRQLECDQFSAEKSAAKRGCAGHKA